MDNSDKIFKPKIPFNIEILVLKELDKLNIGEVKSKDIYEQNSKVFKKDGLFSTEIFGNVGSPERMRRFGYIDIGVSIMHPLIYRHLTSLATFYKNIAEGKAYATFDEKLGDFIPSDAETGKTGYTFFISHYDKLKLDPKDSEERLNKIRFIKKYSLSEVLTSRWLVIPAGMRDYRELPNGKVMEDQINNLYRKLLTVASTARNFRKVVTNENDLFYNNVKLRLQKVLLEIYEYIENILEGKEGFITGKWLKRRIMYGTRNVLTALPIEVSDADSLQQPKFNQTVVGLLQYLKCITPIAIHKLRTKFLNRVFSPESYNSYLINRKTLKKEIVEISEKSRSKWVTDKGLEGIMNSLLQKEILMSDIIVDDHYLFLVYDDGKQIVVFDDIDQLPADYNRDYVRPMKYIELFYLAIADSIDKYPGFVVRYPVDSRTSTYPTKFYVKTTIKGRLVKYKGIGTMTELTLPEYPIFDLPVFTSMAVHPTRLESLGADFDGDKLNMTVVWEEESIKEIEEKLNSREFYLDESGNIAFSASDYVSEMTMSVWTSE